MSPRVEHTILFKIWGINYLIVLQQHNTCLEHLHKFWQGLVSSSLNFSSKNPDRKIREKKTIKEVHKLKDFNNLNGCWLSFSILSLHTYMLLIRVIVYMRNRVGFPQIIKRSKLMNIYENFFLVFK